MRIRMLRDRDWTPMEDRRVTFRYLGGNEYTVRRSWGEALCDAGDAEEIPAPPRAADEPGSRAVPALRRRKARR